MSKGDKNMTTGAMIWTALKAVGAWVLSNPDVAKDAVEKVSSLRTKKKKMSDEELLQLVDEKVGQLGAAALELDQKIDIEVEALRKEMRTLKTMLTVMGAVLCAAVIAIVLLAIF